MTLRGGDKTVKRDNFDIPVFDDNEREPTESMFVEIDFASVDGVELGSIAGGAALADIEQVDAQGDGTGRAIIEVQLTDSDGGPPPPAYEAQVHEVDYEYVEQTLKDSLSEGGSEKAGQLVFQPRQRPITPESDQLDINLNVTGCTLVATEAEASGDPELESGTALTNSPAVIPCWFDIDDAIRDPNDLDRFTINDWIGEGTARSIRFTLRAKMGEDSNAEDEDDAIVSSDPMAAPDTDKRITLDPEISATRSKCEAEVREGETEVKCDTYDFIEKSASPIPRKITVHDDDIAREDDVKVWFTRARYEISENNGTSQPVIGYSGVPTRDYLIPFTLHGSAEDDTLTATKGDDFNLSSIPIWSEGNILLRSGSTSLSGLTFEIFIEKDSIREPTETFKVILQPPSGITGVREHSCTQADIDNSRYGCDGKAVGDQGYMPYECTKTTDPTADDYLSDCLSAVIAIRDSNGGDEVELTGLVKSSFNEDENISLQVQLEVPTNYTGEQTPTFRFTNIGSGKRLVLPTMDPPVDYVDVDATAKTLTVGKNTVSVTLPAANLLSAAGDLPDGTIGIELVDPDPDTGPTFSGNAEFKIKDEDYTPVKLTLKTRGRTDIVPATFSDGANPNEHELKMDVGGSTAPYRFLESGEVLEAHLEVHRIDDSGVLSNDRYAITPFKGQSNVSVRKTATGYAVKLQGTEKGVAPCVNLSGFTGQLTPQLQEVRDALRNGGDVTNTACLNFEGKLGRAETRREFKFVFTGTPAGHTYGDTNVSPGYSFNNGLTERGCIKREGDGRCLAANNNIKKLLYEFEMLKDFVGVNTFTITPFDDSTTDGTDATTIDEPRSGDAYLGFMLNITPEPETFLEFAFCMSEDTTASYYSDFTMYDEYDKDAAANPNGRVPSGYAWQPNGSCSRPIRVGTQETKWYLRIKPDSHDEGAEKIGLSIKDAKDSGGEDIPYESNEITFTINNEGPLPEAWLKHHGLALADQVVDSILTRVQGNPQNPDENGDGNIATASLGMNLLPTSPFSEDQQVQSLFDRTHDDGGMAGNSPEALLNPRDAVNQQQGRQLRLIDVLNGSNASVTMDDYTFWTRMAFTDFSASEDGQSVDGSLKTLFAGAELRRERTLYGMSLLHSMADGGYGEDYAIKAGTSALVPYAAHNRDRYSVWAAAGMGWGSLSLITDDYEIDTSTGWRMGAFGVIGDVFANERYRLSLTTDGLWTESDSKATEGLASAKASASRIRGGLEGSLRVTNNLNVRAATRYRREEDDAGLEYSGGFQWQLGGLSLNFDGRYFEANGTKTQSASFGGEWDFGRRGTPYASTSSDGQTAFGWRKTIKDNTNFDLSVSNDMYKASLNARF